MTAAILKFPDRKPTSEGALVGAGLRRFRCPKCKTQLQPYRGWWTEGRAYDNYWLCPECDNIFGPPPRSDALGSITLTGGAPGAAVIPLKPTTNDVPVAYEAWVTEDGLVRLSNGWKRSRPIAITPDQMQKIADDFSALARAARCQQASLRGDDRWHVKPHPERPNVFLVKAHLYANRYTERTFVQAEIRKPRSCEVCRTRIDAGVMYREESPKPWAHPNWREVRICSTCIRGRRP